MRFIIDKFHDKFAICELYTDDPFESYITDIEISAIPPEAREGDVITVENGIITIDEAETERRKAETRKLTDDLLYR